MPRQPDPVPKPPPPPPAWGIAIRDHRRRQGRSIRQAALTSGLSDSYWGQVERGHQTVGDVHRPIRPSRATLVLMADTLRLSQRETNELLALAGEPPVQAVDSRPVRGEDVALTGLSRADIALLNAVADRFRATTASGAEPARPLRAVAREGDPAAAPTATELARAERRKQTPPRGKGQQ